MELSTETLKNMARLANLLIDPAELEQLAASLVNNLQFIEQIKSVDTTGIDPLIHPFIEN